MNRRGFLLQSTAAAALPGLAVATSPLAAATAGSASGARPGNPIAVSTYSFWHFDDNKLVKIEDCIEMAGEMGFDGVEILEAQMHRKDNAKTAVPKSLAVLRKAFRNP